MRLRLSDGEERSRVRTIVDRETGELFSCGGPTELSMRGMHRYRHASHRQGREDRVDMRVQARNDRLQSRLDKRNKSGGSSGGDDSGGGDDQDYDDGGGDDTEMGDYALSGVGKTIGKIFGKKKKGAGADSGDASGGAGGIGKVKIKAVPDESDNPANKYAAAAAQKKDSWFDGETMGIDNKIVAVAGAGLALLLIKSR